MSLGRDHIGVYPDIGHHTFAKLAADRWDLVVVCWSCKREVVMCGEALARAYGADRTVEWMARRLKCTSCGTPAPSLKAVRAGGA